MLASAPPTLAAGEADAGCGLPSQSGSGEGSAAGTPNTTSYTDSTVQPATTYSYTVKALDTAGNVSAASPATRVTTAAGFIATVFYKPDSSWSEVNIHYAPAGGQWTTPPGVAMDEAYPGWKKKSLNLGVLTDCRQSSTMPEAPGTTTAEETITSPPAILESKMVR